MKEECRLTHSVPLKPGAPCVSPIVLDAIHGRMTSVLHLDPVRLPAAAIRPVLVLRDQTFQAKLAGLPE